MLALQSADNVNRGIALAANGEQNFKFRIILLEESPQIRFQIEIEPGNRLEDADRLLLKQCWRLNY